MAYVTESYYETTYFGVDAGTDFNRLAARASDDITLACPMAVKDSAGAIDVAELDATQLALLQKATSAQIEYYVQNGDDYNTPGGGSSGGARIGSYSEGSASSSSGSKKPAGLCPRAVGYLEQSGLMSHSARVLGQHRKNWQEYIDE